MADATAAAGEAFTPRKFLGMRLTPLTVRRWRNFKANRRGYWSLWIFSIIFTVTLFAELIANSAPLVIHYKGHYLFPIFEFYSETYFGGEFETEADYRASTSRPWSSVPSQLSLLGGAGAGYWES